jgi:hypothetical protein
MGDTMADYVSKEMPRERIAESVGTLTARLKMDNLERH